MNGMKIAQNLGKSIIGDNKKALLIIQNKEILPKGTSFVSKTLDALRKASNSNDKSSFNLEGFLKMKVQYNPSSLAIMANAEPVPARYLMQHLDSGIPNQNVRPPSIVMTVELVFDAVNTFDAFMSEKFALGLDTVKGALRSKQSVLPQTNALIATLMREHTKNVIFKWADMSFAGEVKEVSARYTMFAPDGRPIRSFVKINIIQCVNDEVSTAYWNSAFDNCFIDKNIPNKKEIGQSYGNLINIKR